ncbi:hypothetical protein, partial [Nocardia brasiliensis]|uniref:hypothetical protein n=1 Tax=Nocardia brasiliensis TaxID=37326 RepID=UPI002458361D
FPGVAGFFNISPPGAAPTPPGAAPAIAADHLIAEMAEVRLRRLLCLTIGLSPPACDILITFSDKLRRVEGRRVDTMESLATLLRTLARAKVEDDTTFDSRPRRKS